MQNNDQNLFNFSVEDYLMLTTTAYNSQSISSILKTVGLKPDRLCKIDQVHSNKVVFSEKPGYYGEADGLITSVECNVILQILTADCIPIFIFDKKSGIYALVHAGWRGVVDKIHYNAINKICSIGSKIDNINIFLGPGIRKCCFEIKDDIIQYFNTKYILKNNDKFFLDLLGLVIDGFSKIGVNKNNISFSQICSYEDKMCYSYRRNLTSNRMYSIMSFK